MLTSDAHRHLGQAAHDPPTTCERDIRLAYGGLRKGVGLRTAPERRVLDVSVEGDAGEATVAVGGGERIAVPVAKEDGKWKVDALYGGVPADKQKDSFK